MMRVVFVALDAAPATAAAGRWLAGQRHIEASRSSIEQLPDALLDSPDVVWLDATAPPGPLPALRSLLSADLRSGILLTGAAVAIPSLLGLEPEPPNDRVDRVWHDDDDELFLFRDFTETPRIRGHASFRRHRLFDGLGSGVYTWWPHDGDSYRATTYRRPAWPVTAGVVAVERAFIHINAERATIWEYAAPRILCIGAFLPFESKDPLFRPHLDRLAANALACVAASSGPLPPGDLYWRPPDPRTVEEPGLPRLTPRAFDREPLPLERTPLRLPGRDAADPFTIAGRRAFGAGSEGAGLREFWVHPVRVMRNVRASGEFVEATVTGLGLERRLRLQGALIAERTHVPAHLPALIVEWSAITAEQAVDVSLEWETDLRLMWPYPAGSPGPLHWRTDPDSLVVRAGHTGEIVGFVADPGAGPAGSSAFTVEDASGGDDARLRCRLDLRLEPGSCARLVVVAETGPGDEVASTLDALRRPAKLALARAASLQRRAHEQLSITSPDPAVDAAVEWARHRLDGFLVETPGVGRSLVAGYWTSRPGWNEARPGYAWYFGRDAAWTALASLALGDFDAARDVLRFLGRHQDLNGKILHECSTSGSTHYDAADSTPLYLLLAARCLAWSGDSRFLRAEWEHVRRAFRFCLSTDRDGDGLIENTGVGHGWIEFGRLGGGRATYYNAGIWTAALHELALAAESIGETGFAAELHERHAKARNALEHRFRDDEHDGYALRIDPTDFTQTATHAVPLLLGQADPARTRAWLDLVASPEFTGEPGVRMIARSEPGFDPASYHGGAIWPLYTGWVSWAEYEAGRSRSAFLHWKQVLDLATVRAKGAWDEVLHGLESHGIGVCPDQAWSAAMAVAPLVYGLLGAEPDATRGRLRLRPQLPEGWDRFEVRNLAIGQARIRLEFRREGSTHIFHVAQEAGATPIRLILEAALPGQGPVAAFVDGRAARLGHRSHGERTIVPVQLVLDHERVLHLEMAP